MTAPIAALSSASSIAHIQNRLNRIEDGKSSRSSQQPSNVLSPQDIIDIKSSMSQNAAAVEARMEANDHHGKASLSYGIARLNKISAEMAELEKAHLEKVKAAYPEPAVKLEGDDAKDIMALLKERGVDSHGFSKFTTFIDDMKYSVDGDTVWAQNRYTATSGAEKAEWIQQIEQSLQSSLEFTGGMSVDEAAANLAQSEKNLANAERLRNNVFEQYKAIGQSQNLNVSA